MLAVVLLHLLPSGGHAQHPEFVGKKLGVYFNGKGFSFTDPYYMWINQFLKAGEDRSWGDNVKAELMIRLGERLCRQMEEITGLDTAVFINGDLEKARILQELYDPRRAQLADFHSRLGVDYVLYVNELELSTRDSKIVYIRSNRFVTQKIDVKVARLEQELFGETSGKGRRVLTCFDEKESDPPPGVIDLYRDESGLGAFFSDLFSAWWIQLVAGEPTSCE